MPATIDRKIPPLMSVTEVATALDVSRQAVLKMITTGRLPAAQAGATWVVRAAAVEALKINQ